MRPERCGVPANVWRGLVYIEFMSNIVDLTIVSKLASNAHYCWAIAAVERVYFKP